MLSTEFVRSKAPMRELGLALRHWEANRNGRVLLPVFLDVSREECRAMRQQYDKPGFWDDWEMPEPAVLDDWATDLERLSCFSGIELSQVVYALFFQTAVQAASVAAGSARNMQKSA